jgi:SAM-dependent methyltransferase
MGAFKSFFKKQTFNPGVVGFFVNPFFFARRSLYDNVKSVAPQIKGDILDVGCGQKPYKHLFEYKKYLGIEVEQEGHDHTNEEVDVFYDGVTIPFDAASFDSAITSQVLEHVFTPDAFLQEIHRILKPNGTLLLTVPFVWDEHEQPYDYARYSSFGLKYLLEKNGFEVVTHIKSLNDTRVIFQLINGYIFKKTIALRRNPKVNLIVSFFFNAWINVLGLIFGFILPKNNDLYLDNIVVAKKRIAS